MEQRDLETVLERLLDTARQVTRARYAAVRVLDAERRGRERFVTSGIDAATRARIGEPPWGFPAGESAMSTFLGAPLTIRGEACGDLYLAEKEHGDFDDGDLEATRVLADWAVIAIDRARMRQDSVERAAQLERAVEHFEATTAIARAVGSETDLARVLELIVERARALARARTVVLLLQEGDRLVAVSGTGQVDDGTLRAELAVDASLAGEVLRSRLPERIADVEERFGVADEPLGVLGAETALLVPLLHRGRSLGVLCAFDRLDEEPEFGDREEELLLSFASSAATAVATARSVEADRLRHSLRSAERERTRWARELHDETLQGLGALRVLLRAGLRSRDGLEQAAREASDQVSTEIANLRALITELRPAALDELGLAAALAGLGRRSREVDGLDVAVHVETAVDQFDHDLQTAIYRLAQEALTNVAKHAKARNVDVRVQRSAEGLRVSVTDDGAGFDRSAPTEGYGLAGMQERAALMGGHLELTTSPRGTKVLAVFPSP